MSLLPSLPRRFAMLILTAPLLLALPARGQDFGALRAADTNGDNAISAEEARLSAEAQFARMDSNHDGQVSQAEFVDSRLALLAALDTDGNGSVSRSEMRDHMLAARKAR